MLTDAEIREQLAQAAASVRDDETRGLRAIGRGSQKRVRRRRARAVVTAAAIGVGAVVVPTLFVHTRQAPPPSAAIVSCSPGRTVVSTPRVAELSSGAVVTIDNDTSSSVVVRLGNQTAVVAPGTAEGQFPLSAGRQIVQCVSGGTATPAASIAVLSARHT
jgi:hypothetical protein